MVQSCTYDMLEKLMSIFSLMKGRPVYIGLAVDLSDYELNIDPSEIKPLNLATQRNPKDEHEAALEAIIDIAKRAQNIVVIVDAYVTKDNCQNENFFTFSSCIVVRFDMK